MNLYLLVPFLAIVWSRNPTIISNVMTFDRTTPASQTHKVNKITKPISTLSVVEIDYDTVFGMHALRKYYSFKKEYFFQVNFTAWQQQPTNANDTLQYKLTFRYMLSRQLNNIQIRNINLTASKAVERYAPKRLEFSKSRCLLFVIGFSNSVLATRSSSVPNAQSLQFVISIIGGVEENDWMFLEVVLIEEDSILCGKVMAQEEVREVQGEKQPKKIQIKPQTLQVFYIFGISKFANETSGKIIYEAQSNSVQVTKSGFMYSIFPIHSTCLYTENEHHSNALIIVLSVLMGITSVLIVAIVAYLIRKSFEGKKEVRPLIVTENVIPSVNALVETEMKIVQRQPSKQPLTQSIATE